MAASITVSDSPQLADTPPTTLAMLRRKGSGGPLVDVFKDAIAAAAANHSV